MKDRDCNINEIERLLSPKAEFKASTGLAQAIMGKAAQPQKTKSRGVFRRYLPWVASAAAAAALVLLAWRQFPEKGLDADGAKPLMAQNAQSQEPIGKGNAAYENALAEDAEIAAKPGEEAINPHAGKEAQAEPKPMAETADVNAAHRASLGDGRPDWPSADFCIINAENYALTEEELAEIERQEHLAYIGQIKDEMEEIELLLKSNPQTDE